MEPVVVESLADADGSGGARPDLDALLREYRPRIFRYCRSRLSDYETAEDVTQEVCMALMTALDRRRPEHSVGAFIFGVAANKIAMVHRARYRRPEEVTESLPEVVDCAAGPEESAMDADTSNYVTSLLNRLPEGSRNLLMLRLAAGLSAEEAAQVLGMTAGAVRVAQHRALKQLRAMVDTGGSR